jgi:hypothetical protein
MQNLKQTDTRLTLFLDFDGVLHRKMDGNFEFMPNLFKVLEHYQLLEIVISSSWRNELSQLSIDDLFGSYAERVVGKTPSFITGSREQEILDYVTRHKLKHFIAVDDDCRGNLFSNNCPWLFKTNYFTGLNTETTQELIKFIKYKLND